MKLSSNLTQHLAEIRLTNLGVDSEILHQLPVHCAASGNGNVIVVHQRIGGVRTLVCDKDTPMEVLCDALFGDGEPPVSDDLN